MESVLHGLTGINMKKIIVYSKVFVLAVVLCLVFGSNGKAAEKRGWYKASDGSMYYYKEDGTKAFGTQRIGKKKYCFNKKGKQLTGWQKIGSNYYYFTVAEGAKGSMRVSATVNKVRLGADGKAKLTSYSKKKLPLLTRANQIMNRITTHNMSKKQKLRACFRYVRDVYWDFQMGAFRRSSGKWDLTYGQIGLITNARNHRADCYTSSCTFAYLANAVGYKVKVISSGKHGWAEINGRIYDPAFARVSRVDSFFGMDYNMSGVDGKPHFKGCRKYVIAI